MNGKKSNDEKSKRGGLRAWLTRRGHYADYSVGVVVVFSGSGVIFEIVPRG